MIIRDWHFPYKYFIGLINVELVRKSYIHLILKYRFFLFSVCLKTVAQKSTFNPINWNRKKPNTILNAAGIKSGTKRINDLIMIQWHKSSIFFSPTGIYLSNINNKSVQIMFKDNCKRQIFLDIGLTEKQRNRETCISS